MSSTAFRFTQAGGLDPNPALIRQRAGAALSVAPSGTTFVTRREGAMLAHYVVFPGDVPEDPVNAAKTVAAHSERTDAPNLATTAALAVLRMPDDGVAGSNPQVHAEIAAVVDAASSSLRDGEWVACSIRKPSIREQNIHGKWVTQFSVGATHHSREANAVLVSMWAGADTTHQATQLLSQVAGALPGFDMSRRPVTLTKSFVRGVAAATSFAGAGYALAPGFLEDVVLPMPQLGWVAVAAGCATLVMSMMDRLPSREKKVRRRLAEGLVPAPAHRVVPAQGARAEKRDDQGNVTQHQRNAAYPLHNEAYLVGAITPFTFVAPHAGAQSGGGSTAVRTAPPQLLTALGPLVGYTQNNDAVHFTDEGDWRGLMALGEAGSGKSALLQGIFGYDVARKSGKVARPSGRFNAQFAFDTKDGASAREYLAWAMESGLPIIHTADQSRQWSTDPNRKPPVIVLNVADKNADLGIDLFPAAAPAVDAAGNQLPPDPVDTMNRARRAVSALKYTFGETSIGAQSFSTLTKVIVGGFVVDAAVAAEAQIPAGHSPFYYAGILLGARGDEMGVRLEQAIRSAGERDGRPDALDAAAQLAPLYGPNVTKAQRTKLCEAPQNKMEQMIAAEQWWSRPMRPSWRQLLSLNATVIIDFGAKDGFLMDEEQREQIASLMLYTLHEEIKLHCVGWQEQNQMVSVYADELKHIARNSPDVINWTRQDGRSFGVRLIVATQEPDQLEDSVRDTVLGLGTLVAFSQKAERVIRAVLSNITVDGSVWEQKDIAQLPKFHAIVRTHHGGTPLTAFTLQVADFRSMRGTQFLDAQNRVVGAAPIEAPQGPGIRFAVYEPGQTP